MIDYTDSDWVGVEPLVDSFAINIGDCMQVWSNDKYQSIEHKVMVNEKRVHFSILFFFNPLHTMMIKILEEPYNSTSGGRQYDFARMMTILLTSMEEEEKIAKDWERRVAFVLVNYESSALFEALGECLKTRNFEERILAMLALTSFINDSARDICKGHTQTFEANEEILLRS
eukprot:Gb_07383 [translate_table: standard]